MHQIRKMSTTVIRKIVSTPLAPKPVAPYNQAIIADRTVYVSGQLGMDRDTLKIVAGGAAAETALALANLEKVLLAAGSSIDNVVKTTIFLNDINDFGAVNEEYKKVFTKDFPARSCFQVGKLPLGAVVEIEAVAIVGDCKTVQA